MLLRELTILNDLAYILECLAVGITGEAKTEMSALIGKLEKIEDSSEAKIYEEAHRKIVEAYKCLSNFDRDAAAGILSSISRKLWHRVLPPS